MLQRRLLFHATYGLTQTILFVSFTGMALLHLRILAFVCSVCPICVARRRWPRTIFGRVISRLERTCPFCLAYAKLHGEAAKARAESKNEASRSHQG